MGIFVENIIQGVLHHKRYEVLCGTLLCNNKLQNALGSDSSCLMESAL